MPRGGNWVWIRVDPKIKAAKDKVKNKRYIRLHTNLLYGYGQYFDGIYRDIDILSSATLAELHEAIFELFDRYDGHAWKFSFDTDNPYSREGRHYVPRFILGYARRGVCCRGDYPGQPESQGRCNLRLSL